MSMTKSNYPRCKTCKFRNKEGDCVSVFIQEGHQDYHKNYNEMLCYSYDEGGSFFVGEEFGCVHHDEK